MPKQRLCTFQPYLGRTIPIFPEEAWENDIETKSRCRRALCPACIAGTVARYPSWISERGGLDRIHAC